MSDTLSDNAKKPVEQPDNDLSTAFKYLSVTADASNKSSPKNLSDMPLDVIGLIIERSDYKEQLILRKVSKSFRSLVDKQKPSCKSLKIFCVPCYMTIQYNAVQVLYSIPEFLGKFKQREKFRNAITVNDYLNARTCFADLTSTLKNPKLQLESFSFESGRFQNFYDCDNDIEEYGRLINWESNQFRRMENVLKSLNHQLSVRECEINLGRYCKVFSILPYLKTGVLEKISVQFISHDDSWGEISSSETMDRVVFLEQWKQAKELELLSEFNDFPMKYATHFEQFHFNEVTVDESLLIRIRDCLSTLDKFGYCLIETLNPFDARKLCTDVGEPAPSNKRTEYVSHYSIPESDYYFEFLFFEKTIEIRKMKRSSFGS